MVLSFKFNLAKTVQLIGVFLQELGDTDKVKLMKLVYLADRLHFIRHGTPITGDRQCAMRWGPVPSQTLDSINGDPFAAGDVFQYLHIDDVRVQLRKNPGTDLLSDTERDVIREIVTEHGAKGTWDLVGQTHRLPEYVECYVEGTSRPIPYERIAKFSGEESRFRLNRPVITPEMASQMNCPFPPDADL